MVDNANKKCGIICVSIKQNGKMVFSFNCWFCDTFYTQMKKFAVHLEQDHENYLTEAKCSSGNANVFTPEVEMEESCLISADEEEPPVFLKSSQKANQISPFHDPLETLEDRTKVNFNGADGCENKISIPKRNVILKPDTLIMDTFSNEGNENYTIRGSRNACDIQELEFSMKNVDEGVNDCFFKPLENKVIVSLLQTFKEYPQFWGTSHTTRYNLNRRPILLQAMVDQLNTQLVIKLKPDMIKKVLNKLCQQYEEYIEEAKIHSSTQEEKTEMWFYSHMDFMKTALMYRLRHKKKHLPKLVRLILLPLCKGKEDWTKNCIIQLYFQKSLKSNQLCDLIDIYKKFQILWDVNNLGYTIKEKRKETLQAMLIEVNNKMKLKLNINNLSQHLSYVHRLYAKDKKQRLECENKQQPFKPSSIFYDNCDFLESNQGPFRCSTCNEISESFNDFRRHTSAHDGSMPYVCPDCGMGFKKKSYYNTHVKRHLGFFKFHCEVCGKGYPFRAELEEHTRSHTGAQPYLCSVCGDSFGRASTYDNHIRRHEERFKYFCEICKRGFNCATRLKDHVKAHLNVRDSICSACGKAFTSRRLLSQHKRVHATKNCICNICGKGFASDIGLRAHKKYHENGGIKKFTADALLGLKVEYYKEYIKGGEFLIAPSSDFKELYLLKCNICDEYFSLFETFFSHHLTHYNDDTDEEPPSPSGALQELFGDLHTNFHGKETDHDDPNVGKDTQEKSETARDCCGAYDEEETILGVQQCKISSKRSETSVDKPDEAKGLLKQDINVKQKIVDCILGKIGSNDEKSTTFEDCKTNAIIYNILKTKENVARFILLYKNQPKLWNSNIPTHLKTKEVRLRCLQQISDELKENSNLELTHQHVEKIIHHLRKNYKAHLGKNKLEDEQTGNSFGEPPQDCFAKDLQFLKPFLEKNPLAVLENCPQDLEPEQIVKILDIYKRCPFLWNTSLIESYCFNRRAEAIQQMIRLIRHEMHLEVNENAIKKYIHCVNINFSRDKRQSAGNAESVKGRSEYFPIMMFLNDHVGPFQCCSCQRVFGGLLQLKLHESQQHGGKPLTCSICKKSFTSVEPYVSHIRRHMNDLNKSCNECGKSFLKTSELRSHMRLHTGAMPYCCNLCGMSFRHASAYNVHRKRHEKKFLYFCPTCSKGFYGKFDMKVHIQTHQDVRLFVCETCGKAFKVKKTMDRHASTHEEGRNHKCSTCGKTFKSNLNLKRHLKKQHEKTC